MNDEKRKATDILLSLEEKISALTRASVANDLNIKLILDRLNKLLAQKSTETGINAAFIVPSIPQVVSSQPPLVEINKEPVQLKRQITPKKKIKDHSKEEEREAAIKDHSMRIPVAQRITDDTGHDLFNAEVIITDLSTQSVVNKLQTNAVGKWQTYLPMGKFSIYITKMDINTRNKIESLQEIEITPNMKALQLPTAMIKRPIEVNS